MPDSPFLLPAEPQIPAFLQELVERDYARLAHRGLPPDLEGYILDRYAVDLTTTYGGYRLKNPWGKASGQLSMTPHQVAEDVAAGLGFVVLKTVIAEDSSGNRAMAPWAVKEARMKVGPIASPQGDRGWTVTWNGRGWWQTFDEYLQLVRDARRMARALGTLVVPSCKYHLPAPGETEWRVEEYTHTTRRLLDAWRESSPRPDDPMPIEKDFSPTLAGSHRATNTACVLNWLRSVPRLMRQGVTQPGQQRPSVRVGLKLFNALFDDEFQLEMLRLCHAGDADERADFLIYGNRLFDPQREFEGRLGVAYGGPELSDRNLRVCNAFQAERRKAGTKPTELLPWSATGNIATGRLALEYALRGATSFQLHTLFQLPAEEYGLRVGNRSQKVLFDLYFHPRHGFLVWLFHIAQRLGLRQMPLRFVDVVGQGPALAAT